MLIASLIAETTVAQKQNGIPLGKLAVIVCRVL
jgi:hypothetical protein